MPVARVQLPDGRIARFEVPDGTTPEQVQAFAEQQFGGDQNDLPVDSAVGAVPAATEGADVAQLGGGDTAGFGGAASNFLVNAAKQKFGTLEAGVSIATGIAAEPFAGIAGLVSAAIPGGRTGAEAVEAVRGLAFQPRTEAGQERLGQVGQIAEVIPDVAKLSGDFIFDLTGNATLATLATLAPEALASMLGLSFAMRGVKTGTRLTKNGAPTPALDRALDKQGLVFENLTPEARAAIPEFAERKFLPGGARAAGGPAEEALKAQIKSGASDDTLAGLKIAGDRVVTDRPALEAIRQQFSEGVVQMTKSATPETRRGMSKQLDIMRKIKGNERLAARIAPTDVVGDAVADRLSFIRSATTSARKDLEVIARNELADTPVKLDNVRSAFASALDNLDVNLAEGPNGTVVPEFKGSAVSADPTSQKVIKTAMRLMSETGPRADALKLHKLKRQLDGLIDFRKKSATGITKAGEKVLKTLRQSINEELRSVNTDYARVNDVMSQSLTAMDDLQKAVGPSVDLFGEQSKATLGRSMRGLLSNNKTRGRLEASIDSIDETAKNLEAADLLRVKRIGEVPTPRFNDDIRDLVTFSTALDDRFGAVSKTGIQGVVESAARRGIKETATEAAITSAKRLQGVNDFQAFRAMNELLKKGK